MAVEILPWAFATATLRLCITFMREKYSDIEAYDFAI